ncbi:CgeB family protein [Virgibacillus ndiopensis]|uniref:CgeB family protein n=1 Tax=Virgibacillus ndiopensis TaxID=2004408 RepID=UPI00159B9245|nr:glycosyltransferase [Virgibacillus ndiopensis]
MLQKAFSKVKRIKKVNDNDVKNILPNISKEFFKIENWYYNKRKINIHIENNNMVIESKNNKVSYLTLFEQNTNFVYSPKEEKRILLNKDALFKISGKVPNNVKATIYIIEYGINEKKVKSNRLFINKESEVNIHPKTKSIRIAIRIQGKGEVSITNFKAIQNFISSKKHSQKNVFVSKKIKDIKMACIFDEFSMESFSNDISLITFTPDNWKKVLSVNKPDLLMVESAWRGNFGSWEYQIGKYNNNERNRKLKELISWCNRYKIPTVFWNKEDPIHFEKFIDAGSLFDYILTTDANMIYKYKEIVKHNRVYSMQFAANPKEHNPTSIVKNKKNKISFAGSYYANRHPDRRLDMDQMLEIAKEFGLDIYDRNFERNKIGTSHFMFPEIYKDNIVGTLKYSEINRAYKDYKLILNVNSVKESPTMFSRRVFEGLACGTPIISSFSIGIKKTFKDIVVLSENPQDLKDRINTLMTNEKSYRELAMAGIREVYRYHTYSHRLKFILDKLQINYQDVEKNVSVIFSINTKDEFQEALRVINSQSYKKVKVVFLISLFEGYEKLLNNYNNDEISTYIRDYAFKYNSLLELIKTEYVTVMDIKNQYGEYYLEDLIHASTYSEADIVGKKSLFNNLDYKYNENEYEYVDSVAKGTALYKSGILKKNSLEDILVREEELIETLFKQYGVKIYSNDQFNIKLNSI